MTNGKLLIIDDEASIRTLLRVSLRAHDYEVHEAKTGKEGLALFAQTRPRLVILDLGLPDIGGLEVLQALRKSSLVPIIILTVRDNEEEKISLLDNGADDYVTKPFSVQELLARVRVALRRRDQPRDQPVFRTGPLEVRFETREVRVQGRAIKLTATEYELLLALIRHGGKIVSHRQLLKEVWGPNYVDHVHYLRVFFMHLRKKIEVDPDHPTLLVNEPGAGYKLALIGDGSE